MKSLIILICLLFSISLLAKDKLTATPTNSPVKETYVKVKLEGFTTIAEVFFKPKNGPTEFPGEVAKEGTSFIGKFKGSTLKPGTYEYRVKIRTASGKSEQDEAASTVFFTFVIDASLEVADPGEAGMKTLAGIDADNSKIRDDAQRWINEKYPMATFPSTNKALKQISKYAQLGVLNATNKAESIRFTQLEGEASGCLKWIRKKDTTRGEKNLRAIFFNTKDRIKANMQGDLNFNGQGPSSKKESTPYERYNELCEFSATKEQN